MEKSVVEKGCEWWWECSLIAEKDGLPSWRPVLVDLPLCSRMRSHSHREVDPTYLASQLGQVNIYTTFETRLESHFNGCLKNLAIVLVLLKTKVNFIWGQLFCRRAFSCFLTSKLSLPMQGSFSYIWSFLAVNTEGWLENFWQRKVLVTLSNRYKGYPLVTKKCLRKVNSS